MLTPARVPATPMTRRRRTAISTSPLQPGRRPRRRRTSAGRAAGWRPGRLAGIRPLPTRRPAGRPAQARIGTSSPAATPGRRPRTSARTGRAPGASPPTLPPNETHIPNAQAAVLDPTSPRTSVPGRPSRVAATGPPGGTRARTLGRPAPRVQGLAAGRGVARARMVRGARGAARPRRGTRPGTHSDVVLVPGRRMVWPLRAGVPGVPGLVAGILPGADRPLGRLRLGGMLPGAGSRPGRPDRPDPVRSRPSQLTGDGRAQAGSSRAPCSANQTNPAAPDGAMPGAVQTTAAPTRRAAAVTCPSAAAA